MPAARSLVGGSRPRRRSLKGWAISLGIVSTVLALVLALRSRPVADPGLLRQEARRAAQQGRWMQAEAALGRLTDPAPDDWLLRAVVATSLNRPEAAARYLAEVPPDGPLAARAALVAGRVELGRYRARPMEEALRRALRLDPKLAEARRSLIYLYGYQGRRPELLEQFAALAEQGPLTFTLVNHWCIAHQEQIQDPDELKSTLERFVENDPGDRWSRLGLARVYRRLGQFDKAGACLAPLPDSDPEARACRAEMALDRGDIEAVTALLAGGPDDHPKLARLRGQLALSRQDAPAALRFFRISDVAEPNRSETLYLLAQALRLVGHPAEAEAYARRASAQRALRDHLQNLSDDRKSPAAFCSRLGSECEAAGYLPEARAWYRLALIDDPLHGPSLEGLSRLTASAAAQPTADAGHHHSK